LRKLAFQIAFVLCREQDHGKSQIAVLLYFLAPPLAKPPRVFSARCRLIAGNRAGRRGARLAERGLLQTLIAARITGIMMKKLKMNFIIAPVLFARLI
jgi:hypothetical protein